MAGLSGESRTYPAATLPLAVASGVRGHEGTRDEIMTLLEYLWRERGLTLVTVTHDSSVARRAQSTAIMRNGQLTIQDSPVGTQ
jgi:hypothetical protein